MNETPIQLPAVVVTPTRDLETDRLVLVIAVTLARFLFKK